MAPTRVRKPVLPKKKPVPGDAVPVEQVNQSDKLPTPDGQATCVQQDQVSSTRSDEIFDNGNLGATVNLSSQADYDNEQSTNGNNGERAASQHKSIVLPKRSIVTGDDTVASDSRKGNTSKRQRRDSEGSSKENQSPSRDSAIKPEDSDEAEPRKIKREEPNLTQSDMLKIGHTKECPIMIEEDPPMDKEAVLAIVKTLGKDDLVALMEDMRQEIPLIEDENIREDSPLTQGENAPPDSHPSQDENAPQDNNPRRRKANKTFKKYVASDSIWMNQQLRDLRKGQAMVQDYKNLVRRFEKDSSSLIFKQDIWITGAIAHLQRCGAQDQKMTEQLEKAK